MSIQTKQAEYANAFVPNKSFRPGPKFVDKAKAYPSEEPFICSHLG